MEGEYRVNTPHKIKGNTCSQAAIAQVKIQALYSFTLSFLPAVLMIQWVYKRALQTEVRQFKITLHVCTVDVKKTEGPFRFYSCLRPVQLPFTPRSASVHAPFTFSTVVFIMRTAQSFVIACLAFLRSCTQWFLFRVQRASVGC